MKESKKLLIGFGAVLILCCFAAGISILVFREFSKRVPNMVNSDPASVEQAKKNIAEFDIPEGYSPTVMSFFMYDIVNLTPESYDHRMTIMLMQYSSLLSGNTEQMKQQLRQAAQQQSHQAGGSMHLVDTREEVIRGETVTVTISESDYQSFTIRQWMTMFTGNKGPTILMIQGPVEDWDDQIIEDFLKSIK